MVFGLAQGLRELLFSVVRGAPSREQVSRLVKICHALATPFVASKTAAGRANPQLIGLSASDLAYDFIAELFRQDAGGQLIQIRVYFSGIDFSQVTEGELLGHLRRLVFASANQGLFRMYNEIDPSLGKILRNVKLSVSTLQNFDELVRLGEPCLAPAMTDPLLHLPPMERGYLEQSLTPLVRGDEHIPELLATLSLVLREQEEYCRVVPLVMAALVFRSLYERCQDREEPAPDPDQKLLAQAMEETIARVCQEVLDGPGRKYQKEGGPDDAVLQAYGTVIGKHLSLRLVEKDGEEFSYYAGLKALLPSLTPAEYKALHREKVEYLGRLAYERFVRQMRKDITR